MRANAGMSRQWRSGKAIDHGNTGLIGKQSLKVYQLAAREPISLAIPAEQRAVPELPPQALAGRCPPAEKVTIMLPGRHLVLLLGSLRVGFRSLARQRPSNEVGKVSLGGEDRVRKIRGIIDKVSKKRKRTQTIIDGEWPVAADYGASKLQGSAIAGN